LPLHTFKRWVQTSPTRCARNPNVHIRLNRGRIIQVARTDHAEIWTVGGLGEQMCAAFRAKLTSDFIATVGDLRVLRKHPGKAESVYGDKQIHRPIRRKMLAVAAPANASCQRFRYELKTHCAAKTTTGSFSHVFVPLLSGLGLTFDMRGSTRLAGASPLDGRVRAIILLREHHCTSTLKKGNALRYFALLSERANLRDCTKTQLLKKPLE